MTVNEMDDNCLILLLNRLFLDQRSLMFGVEAVAHGHGLGGHCAVAKEDLIGLGVFEAVAHG